MNIHMPIVRQVAVPMLTLPDNQRAIRRAAVHLCALLGWAVVHEMTLPGGRRADMMALAPDGGFVCIEVKSGPRDYLTDTKWPDYRAHCDALYFAVDDAFPLTLLPDDVGIMVAAIDPHAAAGSVGSEAALLREAPRHRLAPATRRALTQRFAMLAAFRLAALEDPGIQAQVRTALRVE